MTLPTAPRSVVLDRDRHVWVRREHWWECVTDGLDGADNTFNDDLSSLYGPLTVLYDAGEELL